MKMLVMMGAAPAQVFSEKMNKGGVNAVAGKPLMVDGVAVQGLPAEQEGVNYLVSAPVATALQGAGRNDIWRLPPDASSNAPDAFGLDYLIQVV